MINSLREVPFKNDEVIEVNNDLDDNFSYIYFKSGKILKRDDLINASKGDIVTDINFDPDYMLVIITINNNYNLSFMIIQAMNYKSNDYWLDSKKQNRKNNLEKLMEK